MENGTHLLSKFKMKILVFGPIFSKEKEFMKIKLDILFRILYSNQLYLSMVHLLAQQPPLSVVGGALEQEALLCR